MAREFLTRVQNKRDTSANWTKNNPVILNGEIILVDTAEGELRAKIGDGTKTYTQLPFSDEVLKSLINTVAQNVADNTTARHSHSNKDILDKITGIVTKDNVNTPAHTSDLVDYSGFKAGSQQIISQIPTKTSDITNDSGFTTETYVNTKVAGIVNSAPETLDTLNELAEALGNDPNFATTMATELGKKVDKVTGKGLSTNDYTTAEKDKLGGIEANANNYSLPVATSTALGGVKSGTDITVDTSGNVSVNDDSHNHVISNVDGLQTALDGKVSTVTGKGLSTNDYTTAEKNKLANIAANANNYSLPVATSSVLGGVKSGTDITVDSSGNVSVNDDSHNHVISNVDGLQSALDAKVSAVSGKGLSTNDYTTDEKNKLSGIAKNANNYSLPAAGSSLGGVKSGGDVSISNGTISYSSTVPVSKGGTGATTAAAACTNLGALPLSGGTLTGNLTGKYIAGTWLQTTSVSEQSAAASKIATIDGDGWIYYRTPAHIVSDLNIFQTTGGTITGAVKLTSGTNYGASLPTTIPAAGTIFFKKM
jgi:hypothetical protein